MSTAVRVCKSATSKAMHSIQYCCLCSCWVNSCHNEVVVMKDSTTLSVSDGVWQEANLEKVNVNVKPTNKGQKTSPPPTEATSHRENVQCC